MAEARFEKPAAQVDPDLIDLKAEVAAARRSISAQAERMLSPEPRSFRPKAEAPASAPRRMRER